MRLFKCTRSAGTSVHNFHDPLANAQWDMPVQDSGGAWIPGAWKPPVDGPLRMHHQGNGYHLTPESFLIKWLNDEIYSAEIAGDHLTTMDCVLARSARLTAHHLLPPKTWGEMAIDQARLGFDLFRNFNYNSDVNDRLRRAIDLAEIMWDKADFDPSFQTLPEGAGQVWRHAAEVVDLCDRDSLSGFLPNENTRAAMYAARAVSLLKDLAYPQYAPVNSNAHVVKQQAGCLGFAVQGLVQNVMLKNGHDVDTTRIAPVAQPFLAPHPELTCLSDAARFNVTQTLNDRLLDALYLQPGMTLTPSYSEMPSFHP